MGKYYALCVKLGRLALVHDNMKYMGTVQGFSLCYRSGEPVYLPIPAPAIKKNYAATLNLLYLYYYNLGFCQVYLPFF